LNDNSASSEWCPVRGADYSSGWREDADSVDVIGSDFDYVQLVENEFSTSPKPPGTKPLRWIAGIVLLVAFYVFAVR